MLAPRLMVRTDRIALACSAHSCSALRWSPTSQTGAWDMALARRPKFLRQTFHEFAGHSRHWCNWAQALYQRLRRSGKGHHAALRVLAFEWLRILFHCWKTRTGYDESIYLKSLQKRNLTLWAEIQLLPTSQKEGGLRRSIVEKPVDVLCIHRLDFETSDVSWEGQKPKASGWVFMTKNPPRFF